MQQLQEVGKITEQLRLLSERLNRTQDRVRTQSLDLLNARDILGTQLAMDFRFLVAGLARNIDAIFYSAVRLQFATCEPDRELARQALRVLLAQMNPEYFSKTLSRVLENDDGTELYTLGDSTREYRTALTEASELVTGLQDQIDSAATTLDSPLNAQGH